MVVVSVDCLPDEKRKKKERKKRIVAALHRVVPDDGRRRRGGVGRWVEKGVVEMEDDEFFFQSSWHFDAGPRT